MKLRINRDSIRLRLLRSEVARFVETGRIEETVYFGAGEDDRLTYALEHEADRAEVGVRYGLAEVVVVVPRGQAALWAKSEEVGIYSSVDIGREGRLEVIVEKDFACLDLSDAENVDTFANPHAGVAC